MFPKSLKHRNRVDSPKKPKTKSIFVMIADRARNGHRKRHRHEGPANNPAESRQQ